MILEFLSNRTNLTIFQFLLYFVVGYIMGAHLSWSQLGIMYVVLLLIQLITRTKAVADGMMFGQMMEDNKMDANEVIKQMKKEIDRLNKDDLN